MQSHLKNWMTTLRCVPVPTPMMRLAWRVTSVQCIKGIKGAYE
jgi:hypothetical protein